MSLDDIWEDIPDILDLETKSFVVEPFPLLLPNSTEFTNSNESKEMQTPEASTETSPIPESYSRALKLTRLCTPDTDYPMPNFSYHDIPVTIYERTDAVFSINYSDDFQKSLWLNSITNPILNVLKLETIQLPITNEVVPDLTKLSFHSPSSLQDVLWYNKKTGVTFNLAHVINNCMAINPELAILYYFNHTCYTLYKFGIRITFTLTESNRNSKTTSRPFTQYFVIVLSRKYGMRNYALVSKQVHDPDKKQKQKSEFRSYSAYWYSTHTNVLHSPHREVSKSPVSEFLQLGRGYRSDSPMPVFVHKSLPVYFYQNHTEAKLELLVKSLTPFIILSMQVGVLRTNKHSNLAFYESQMVTPFVKKVDEDNMYFINLLDEDIFMKSIKDEPKRLHKALKENLQFEPCRSVVKKLQMFIQWKANNNNHAIYESTFRFYVSARSSRLLSYCKLEHHKLKKQYQIEKGLEHVIDVNEFQVSHEIVMKLREGKLERKEEESSDNESDSSKESDNNESNKEVNANARQTRSRKRRLTE